jgi:hypothetical protein
LFCALVHPVAGRALVVRNLLAIALSMNTKDKNPTYYFIDVDLKSRRLIGWGTEKKDTVEVHLSRGYHRVFLTKGQYNKLEKQLREG